MTKDERVRFTFRLPQSLFAQLKTQADSLGVSVNSLILQILWDWADKQKAAPETEPPQNNKSA